MANNSNTPNPLQNVLRAFTTAPEPNPPQWPDTDDSKVILVSPTDMEDADKVTLLQQLVSDPYDKDSFDSSKYHFSNRRRAVLFQPGKYTIDLQLGAYAQALGVGTSASDVVFDDVKMGDTVVKERFGVFCPATDTATGTKKGGTSLYNVWRGAENFTSNVSGRSTQYGSASAERSGMQWSVSQGTSLRRVVCQKGLTLGSPQAPANGGLLANCQVLGKIDYGTHQRQFLHRHSQFQPDYQAQAQNVWSLVYTGCTDEVSLPYPTQNAPKKVDAPATTVAPTPEVRLEKPYIAMKGDGKKFELRVPRPQFGGSTGPRLDGAGDEVRDFARVRVVRSDEPNVTQRIQSALNEGKDVVLAAGIFKLNDSIVIKESNRVLLGIGLSTLVAPPNGAPCIQVEPGCVGVRLAGLILEACPKETAKTPSALLEWGNAGVPDFGDKHRPNGLFDVTCRIGGLTGVVEDRAAVQVECLMRLHSGHIIGDNVWLWRADHAPLADKMEQPNYPDESKHYWRTEDAEFAVTGSGLEVTGNDVTFYGLTVDHCNGHQTVWKGNRGTTVHYKSTLPPSTTQANFGDAGFRSYLVEGEAVTHHAMYAPGIFTNFRNHVVVDHAMETPAGIPLAINPPPKVEEDADTRPESEETPSITVVQPYTALLGRNFGIMHILNQQGDMASEEGQPTFLATAEEKQAKFSASMKQLQLRSSMKLRNSTTSSTAKNLKNRIADKAKSVVANVSRK